MDEYLDMLKDRDDIHKLFSLFLAKYKENQKSGTTMILSSINKYLPRCIKHIKICEDFVAQGNLKYLTMLERFNLMKYDMEQIKLRLV